ncbi:MAG: hypothetical protein ABIG89_04430 [Candidatus Woesearchaeota archaeon]
MTNLDMYVKKELSKGFSKKEVKAVLLKAGWPENEVDNALENVKETEFPQHKIKTRKFWIILIVILIIVLLIGSVLYVYSYHKPKIIKECTDKKSYIGAYNCLLEHGLLKPDKADDNCIDISDEIEKERCYSKQ